MSAEQLTCPYCLAPIRSDETLAVCSECNLAHHDECWRENRACTRYGCKGKPTRMSTREYLNLAKEESAPIDLSNEGLDKQYCPHCGGLIKATAIKCKHCKRILPSTQHSQQHPQQPMAPGSQQAVTRPFSWGAVLLGPIWYLLHGMWLKAISLVVVHAIAASIFNGLGSIGMAIWAGFMFHNDYQRYRSQREQFLW